VSWNFNDTATGSLVFNDGFDPDVAIWSDATNGTFMEIVFENNSTGRIDAYTYNWNATTNTFNTYNLLPFKCTLSNDATMKCKNPNLAATKDRAFCRSLA
jgi:hypothetical protein